MEENRPRRGGRHMGPPGMGGGEKAKNFKGTLKKLFVYLKPYYFKLAVVIIFAACSRVINCVASNSMPSEIFKSFAFST